MEEKKRQRKTRWQRTIARKMRRGELSKIDS
jgi:hypothetical protein